MADASSQVDNPLRVVRDKPPGTLLVDGAPTSFGARTAELCNVGPLVVWLGPRELVAGEGIRLAPGDTYSWSRPEGLYGIIDADLAAFGAASARVRLAGKVLVLQ